MRKLSPFGNRIEKKRGRVAFRICRAVMAVVCLLLGCTCILSCGEHGKEYYDVGVRSSSSHLYLATEDDAALAVCGGNVVSCGKRSLEVMKTDGERVAYRQISMKQPRVVSAGLFFLVYDENGYTYQLYKRGECLWEKTSDYPIFFADIAQNGSFALVTRTEDTVTAACLFNADGGLMNRFLRKDYIVDCRLSSDGRKILLLSVDTLDGVSCANVMLAQTGRARVLFETSVPDAFPLGACIMRNGKTVVSCNDGIRTYSPRGKLRHTETVDLNRSDAICRNGYGTFVLTDGVLTVFGTNGRKTETFAVEDGANGMIPAGKSVFLLYGTKIVKVTWKKGTVCEKKVDGFYSNVVAMDEKKLLIRYGAELVSVTF